jgi:hypothetical protein
MKKTKCKHCDNEFIPTAGVTPVICPSCGLPAAAAATARASFATGEPVMVGAGTGDEFDLQWMPPGPQSPVCFVEGEPRKLKFTVKAAHAGTFNSQLQRLRNLAAAGQGDEPFIDFNHEDGRASGRPTEMYYGGEDPKRGGIRLKGKWTASGKASVTGPAPEFTRFSPEWLFDDDEEPLAITPNLGGLVNRAAFKTIASVKAGAANHKPQNKMTEQEIKDAIMSGITAGLKPIGERIGALETAQGKGALDETMLTKAIAKAMEPVTQKLTTFEADSTNAKKAQAKSAVKVHVDRGAIAPDEKLPSGKLLVDYHEEAYLANAADADAAMKKLPGKNLQRFVLGGNDVGDGFTATASYSEPQNRILAGARKMREKNKAIASDAQALETYLKTPEGNAAYEDSLLDLSKKRVDLRHAR